MNTTSKSYTRVEDLVQDVNPFQMDSVVRTDQVWSDDHFDFEVLNKQAFDKILSCLTSIAVQAERSSGGAAIGCVLLGPKGWGKTHLIARVRRFIQKTEAGIFIYACEYGNLRNVRYQFLQSLVNSLKQPGFHGVSQCQNLATHLIEQAFSKPIDSRKLIKYIDQTLPVKRNLIEQISQTVIAKFSGIADPDIIKALIWSLSTNYYSYAVKWLSGNSLSNKELDFMGLAPFDRKTYDDLAFTTTCNLLRLIGIYTTPVICFDQLDGTEHKYDMDEKDSQTQRSPEIEELSGQERTIVVASFISDLFNNLRKGIIITAMYAESYDTFQDGTDYPEKDMHRRKFMRDRFAQEFAHLRQLHGSEIQPFLESYLGNFYEKYGVTPPNPIYPFTEVQLSALKSQQFSVREIFQWASEQWSGSAVDKFQLLEASYQDYEAKLSDFMDDNHLIAQALIFGFRHLIRLDMVVEQVKVKEVDTNLPTDKIDFCIVGVENGKTVRIGVSVVQYSNSNSVKARINHLSKYDKYGLTRGCMVRSKTISETANDLNNLLNRLLTKLGGEWVSFKADQLKPLIILYKMSRSLVDDVISRADFQDFIDECHPLQENYIIQEILSDPSGQAPKNLTDEDQEFEELVKSLSELDNISLDSSFLDDNDFFRLS